MYYEQRFENGGNLLQHLKKSVKRKKQEHSIHFKPDPTIFSVTKYNYETLCERLRESAFLLKGLKIELIDERE